MTANQMLIAVSKERRFSPPFPLSLSLSLTLSPLVLLLNHSFLLLQGCTFRLSCSLILTPCITVGADAAALLTG